METLLDVNPAVLYFVLRAYNTAQLFRSLDYNQVSTDAIDLSQTVETFAALIRPTQVCSEFPKTSQ